MGLWKMINSLLGLVLELQNLFLEYTIEIYFINYLFH